ncbi:NERD domain-containing protein [Candidatus Saccharibacteria bacterium]|nr:NERD domain-containing protein [Candidatus Saccharibacteria bacterium]
MSSRSKRGKQIEKQLYKNLRRLGVPRKQIFRNIYVPKYDGKFAEVDLVVLSKKGLLVFECKNFYGKIYGDGRKATWYKCSAGKRYPFVNPVIQNAGHIKYLLKYFHKLGLLPAYSFIVVSKNGEWITKNINPKICFVRDFGDSRGFRGCGNSSSHGDSVNSGGFGDFMKRYRSLNNSPIIAKNYNTIMSELKSMEYGGRLIGKGFFSAPGRRWLRIRHSLSVKTNSWKWKLKGRKF